MTSFKRKQFDRAHRKGFHGNNAKAKRDRDGNVTLKYGRHTTLVQFVLSAETQCASCDGTCGEGTCTLDALTVRRRSL